MSYLRRFKVGDKVEFLGGYKRESYLGDYEWRPKVGNTYTVSLVGRSNNIIFIGLDECPDPIAFQQKYFKKSDLDYEFVDNVIKKVFKNGD